ncbi:hypothetical protein Tco_0886066 [Tanacetum coccineum]
MALVDDELSVGKNHARNGEWIDITIKKCRDYLLALKQAKLEAVTFQIQNTELTKLNHALQEQLKEERKVDEKWLNSLNKGASPSSEILKSKAKPFLPCTHRGFNDHRLDDYLNYLECEICGSYDHSTLGHNRFILVSGGVLAESS